MPKRILITGGCGFVGHHCVEHLLKNTDWEIIILDALTYAGNLNRITDIEIFPKVKDRIKFIWHDLKAPISETTHKLIGKLDYCIHFASETHVDRSLKDARPFALSNVVGTTTLLEYLKKYQPNLTKYIGFNTDEVFGPAREGYFYKEEDKFRPSNPYAAAKAGQWCMEYAFAHAFRLPICMVHSMNIIGERQHPEKFVPKTIRAIKNGKKVTLHGRGPQDLSSRCWIHARNVSDALLFLLEKGEPEQTYNIVGEEKTVLEIANWICEVIKGRKLKEDEIEYIDYHTARPGHDKRYALSGEKLAKMGWKPPLDLEASLKKAVRWIIRPENQKWLNL
jgi:dTDP-glucose 4,6-dehydratase